MTAAEQFIREEIARSGPISFARFMELAMYAPGAGYYARPGRSLGRRGDFYTSVSVGPAFGFLLAARLARWSQGFETFEVVEAAAHDGSLAEDLLSAWERFHPELWPRVSYRILEPLRVRRAEQEARLERWGGRVRWHAGWSELGGPITGVIIANELLDAFPVHRHAWDAAGGRWFEWGVGVGAVGGNLDWVRLPSVCPLEAQQAAALGPVLPDGFIVERSPGAEAWWSDAARALARGWLVTADYGHDDASVLRPERTRGTARGYFRHQVTDELLARPGEQDLTAHVDFPRIRDLGEQAGLTTEVFLPQGRWLGSVAVEVLGGGGAAAAWLSGHARQLQTLTHPVHLGQALRVLVQRRA